MPANLKADPLLEEFAIRLPDGRTWQGYLYSTTSRKSGRRFVVKDRGGKTLFSSGDCADFGNAQDMLDRWLAGEIARSQTG